MRPTPIATAAALALVAAATVTGCSSSTPASTAVAPTAAAPTASAVGGMTTCDVQALTKPSADYVAASSPDMKLDQVDEVQCADGWAAVLADISPATGSEGGYAVTLVFEAEGQFWIPKDRAEVCGTTSTSDPGTRPDDSQVPAAIWSLACNSN